MSGHGRTGAIGWAAGKIADAARRLLARTPHNAPEPEPGRVDLRGCWALAGAWAAALGGVRLGQLHQVFWAVGLWLLAGAGLLALLRPRHGRLGPAATPSFAAPALCCAAAALVFTQLVLPGPGPIPRRSSRRPATVTRCGSSWLSPRHPRACDAIGQVLRGCPAAPAIHRRGAVPCRLPATAVGGIPGYRCG